MNDSKLYVGNLSYGTTEQTLTDHFSQAGTVASATIIKDKMTGRSKGFGFIEMSSAEEAQKAIEMLHEKDFDGRPLTVNVARPLAERPPRRDNGGDFGGGGSRW
jgi:RNA recognition motif-containing protein